MRTLVLALPLLLLAACAHAPAMGIGAPMHAEGNQQVGWQQVTTGDGNPLFVVRSNGKASYSEMIKVAEAQAVKFCPEGYSVVDVEGNDQPQVETLNPQFVLASEVRFEVRCYQKQGD